MRRFGTRTSPPPFARITSLGSDPASVLVGHVEDLLLGVLADLLRVIGRDMRLNVLDQLVVRLAFDIDTTRTVNNLHVSSLIVDSASDLRMPRRYVSADSAKEAYAR
jgi:hypothetical protein